MLITITNSNCCPEVNSSEVSLKLQCKFCVCTGKHPKHLLGGGAYMTFVFAHTCVYKKIIYESVPPLENSHSKDELKSIIQATNLLSCVRSPIILKTNCNHHYNDHSSYTFSLVCNRSMSTCRSNWS